MSTTFFLLFSFSPFSESFLLSPFPTSLSKPSSLHPTLPHPSLPHPSPPSYTHIEMKQHSLKILENNNVAPTTLSAFASSPLTCEDVVRRVAAGDGESVATLLDASGEQMCDLFLGSCSVVYPAVQRKKNGLSLYASTLGASETTEAGGVRVSTGLPSLDAVLRGGVEPGMVTELAGVAGAGKTQMCLSLAVEAHMGGTGVVYVDAETTYSSSRLVEIATQRYPDTFAGSEEGAQALTEAVTVYRVGSSSELMAALEGLEDKIVETEAGLVIIDSVAALIKQDFDASSLVARQEMLSRMASLLKWLASVFSIPIVVTNHISLHSHGIAAATGNRNQGHVAGFIPALGNTWTHAVNVRIMLATDLPSTLGEGGGGGGEEGEEESIMARVMASTSSVDKRGIVIAKSPSAPRGFVCWYAIGASGCYQLL